MSDITNKITFTFDNIPCVYFKEEKWIQLGGANFSYNSAVAKLQLAIDEEVKKELLLVSELKQQVKLLKEELAKTKQHLSNYQPFDDDEPDNNGEGFKL